MGNCLVTKLKSVVDSDNLDIFGYYKVKVNYTGSSNFSLMFSAEPTGAYSPDGTFNDGQTEVHAGDGNRIGIAPNSSLTIMVPKYAGGALLPIDQMGNAIPVSYNLNDLDFIPTTVTNITGHLNLNGTENNKIKGSLSNLFRFISTPSSFILDANANTDIDEIDINTLPSNWKIRVFFCNYCTKLKGSLDTYLVSRIGNTPSSVNIQLGATNVTFNGKKVRVVLSATYTESSITVTGVGVNAVYDINSGTWNYNA